MSLSTTSTATYTLTKYSRCYPQHASLYQSQAQRQTDEWQHFTNPVMRLILDVKKRVSGDLEAYRLRIVWSLNTNMGPDAMDVDVDQRDVVFEDLELLAFSKVPYDPQTQAAGLPLKAVYRDAIVGIRYLHPRIVPPGCAAVYRRIQMNFESNDSAQSFIDAIQQVCPCKANPNPNAPAKSSTVRPLAQSRPSIINAGASTQLSVAPHSTEDIQTLRRATTLLHYQPHTPKFGQHIFNPTPPAPSVPPVLSRQTSTFLSPSDPAANSAAATSNPVSDCHASFVVPETYRISTHSRTTAPSSDPSSDSTLVAASAPPSSAPPRPVVYPTATLSKEASTSQAPTSTSNSLPIPTEPAASAPVLTSNSANGPNALLAALRETPALYDLPRDELEYLVAQVIREDGFVKLLETLDSMWKMKGLLGMIEK
ncbi:hypothetical protein BXZ70DRAFT_912663 [Cristinia sonorae]|uniref:Uncharacterized protein n=1 Tax=Cristinia sonorae TaxID=1940300 RepID=A0A8K0UZB2_9AGAR|nr:hypothetical protein BXZ70DRAFT_912663 [Cristinia sonorae]